MQPSLTGDELQMGLHIHSTKYHLMMMGLVTKVYVSLLTRFQTFLAPL
jgi:hypothetical protein